MQNDTNDEDDIASTLENTISDATDRSFSIESDGDDTVTITFDPSPSDIYGGAWVLGWWRDDLSVAVPIEHVVEFSDREADASICPTVFYDDIDNNLTTRGWQSSEHDVGVRGYSCDEFRIVTARDADCIVADEL